MESKFLRKQKGNALTMKSAIADVFKHFGSEAKKSLASRQASEPEANAFALQASPSAEMDDDQKSASSDSADLC
jgi:Tfp pilus assembly protein PilE